MVTILRAMAVQHEDTKTRRRTRSWTISINLPFPQKLFLQVAVLQNFLSGAFLKSGFLTKMLHVFVVSPILPGCPPVVIFWISVIWQYLVTFSLYNILNFRFTSPVWGPNILTGHSVFRDHVSHPCETTDKIITCRPICNRCPWYLLSTTLWGRMGL